MTKALPIILASTSPRRIDLLRQAGFEPQVIAPDADETPIRGEAPRTLVSRLSREKAGSVMAEALEHRVSALIVAADTIVVAPDGRRILGKPRNREDARKMLASLQGREHTVLTGYTIILANRLLPARTKSRVVVSKVRMRKLTTLDIGAYVATGEPMDKAGSYAAQGIGMCLIESIRGSYTNVVGLPMAQLLADLEKHFAVPLFSGERFTGKLK